MPTTEKQRELLEWAIDPDRDCDIAVLIGDRGSLKSYAAVLAILSHSLQYTDADYVLAGRTAGAVMRNLMPPLLEISRSWGLSMRKINNSTAYECLANGNKFHIFGSPTLAAAETVQGLNAYGAVVDEAPLTEKDFMEQVLAVCRKGRWIKILTGNAEDPTNHIKVMIDDPDIPMLYMEPTLEEAEDAGIIDPSYREGLMRTLSPTKIKRWLERQWVGRSGLCFGKFTPIPKPEAMPQFTRVEGGGDFGMSNPTTVSFFGMLGPRQWAMFDEYYNDDDITVAEHADNIVQMCKLHGCREIVMDPRGTPLIRELRARGIVVRLGNADVVDGIEDVERSLANGELTIYDNCTNFIREANAYVWLDNKQDKPRKKDDHTCDGTRYWCRRRLRRNIPRPRRKPRGL